MTQKIYIYWNTVEYYNKLSNLGLGREITIFLKKRNI